MSFRHVAEPDLEVARPRGYLIHAGWPQLVEVIEAHRLVTHRLTEPIELEVETIRVDEPVFAEESFQGTVMVTNFVTARQTETRRIPAGSLWIPADQPDFAVAVQLFEPEAPDSLLRWGALDTVFERKTYIGLGRLEEEAGEMLEDDAIRAQWEAALEEPDFAADWRARYDWLYRRTPYWDEQVGLLPIYRVMHAPLPTKGH